MDTSKQSVETSTISMMPPAQLWVGTPEQLLVAVRKLLKQHLCPNRGCGSCLTCRNLDAQQHHNVHWFMPDGWYKREDLEDLFTTISLSLEDDQRYFFIIQKADCLSPACFNSLLKSIEEPPRGYFFIFLAERLYDVANTIRSRCHIQQFSESSSPTSLENPIVALFLTSSKPLPFALLQALEEAQPDEQLTIELVDRLLAHWLEQYRILATASDTQSLHRAEKVIALLKDALEEPPMPGSSPLFWKQLFLQIYS